MTRGRRRAWVLNFDADDELADPSRTTRSRSMEARCADLASRVIGLVPEGDLVVAPGTDGAGLPGRCFCPTSRALATLRRSGAIVPPAPPMAVLRAVNHRRFAAELGQTLPGAQFVEREEQVDELLSARGDWLLKQPFGFAGRGHLHVRDGLTENERRWVRATLARGEGLQVEPLVERVADFGLHGFLDARGATTLGAPTVQLCDARGAWRGSTLAAPGSLSDAEHRSLFEATEEAAEALARAGFFGPFGVDAFRYRIVPVDRGTGWNPRCEINARYSMGWAIGMGARRPDLTSD